MSTDPPDVLTQHQIASYIRAGCYPHVAAEASGVSQAQFERWMKRGQARNAAAPFAGFAVEIRTATAQARMAAEARAFRENPRAWLEHGPGREMPGDPGWSGAVRAPTTGADEFNPLAHPDVMQLLTIISAALRGFPDAHAHISQLTEKAFTIKHHPPIPEPEGDSHDPRPSHLSPAA